MARRRRRAHRRSIAPRSRSGHRDGIAGRSRRSSRLAPELEPARQAARAGDFSRAHRVACAALRRAASRAFCVGAAAPRRSRRDDQAPISGQPNATLPRGRTGSFVASTICSATASLRFDGWQHDPVHDAKAPDAFWASVDFLDPRYGDHKIIWELNRHQHFLALGRRSG